MWWVRRRDALLADLAHALVFFGAERVEDPGAGELAATARILAEEYRTSDLGPHIHQAGRLLEQAATELHSADRFRGVLLPVVVRHLRCALSLLAHARSRLRTPTAGGYPACGHSAPRRAAAR